MIPGNILVLAGEVAAPLGVVRIFRYVVVPIVLPAWIIRHDHLGLFAGVGVVVIGIVGSWLIGKVRRSFVGNHRQQSWRQPNEESDRFHALISRSESRPALAEMIAVDVRKLRKIVTTK